MVPRFLGLMGLLGVLGQKGKLFLIMIGNIFLVCFPFCPNTPNTPNTLISMMCTLAHSRTYFVNRIYVVFLYTRHFLLLVAFRSPTASRQMQLMNAEGGEVHQRSCKRSCYSLQSLI